MTSPRPTADDRQRCMNLLFPVALRAVERGEFKLGQADPVRRESYARIIANYATSDLILTGRTLLLDMNEVRGVMKELGRCGFAAALPPFGLSRQSTLPSQAKPAAANAKGEMSHG